MTTLMNTISNPSYHPLKVKKSPDYLHYWSQNVSDKVAMDIGALFTIDKKQVITNQLIHFRNLQNKQKQNLSAMGFTADEIGMLYDVNQYQTGLTDILINESNAIFPPKPKSLEEAITGMKSVNLRAANSSIAAAAKSIEDFINVSLMPSQNDLANLQSVLVHEYAQYTGISKSSKLTNAQRSKTCERILRDIAANNNDSFFRVRDVNAASHGLDTANRKLIMLSAALKEFQGEGLPIKRMTVKAGDTALRKANSRKQVSGTSEILQALMKKAQGSAQNIYANAAELVSYQGTVNTHAKFFKEAKERLGLEKMNGQYLGNKTNGISVQTYTKNNPTYEKMLDSLEQISQQTWNVRSTSDYGIIMSKDGVEANINFTVKAGESTRGPLQKNNAIIKLKDGQPLLTLLGREAGFSSSQLFAIMQALVAHGDEGYYESVWESVKQAATDLAFLNALAGLDDNSKATFMVLGNQITTVENILAERLQGNVGANLKAARWNTGSLGRNRYLQMNKWIDATSDPNGTPNHELAEQRSEFLYKDVSRELYATKIQIDMTIKSSSALLNILS